MLAYPSLLVPAAQAAGMRTPTDDEVQKYEDPKSGRKFMMKFVTEYPHFHVFCIVQLCRPMRMGEQWDNAKVIAGIKEDRLRTITLEELIELGLCFTAN